MWWEKANVALDSLVYVHLNRKNNILRTMMQKETTKYIHSFVESYYIGC